MPQGRIPTAAFQTLGALFAVFILAIILLWLNTKSHRLHEKKHTKTEINPYNHPLTIERFQNLMCIWDRLAEDNIFKKHCTHLMKTNSAIPPSQSNKGSVELYKAFVNMDQYVKNELKWLHDVRITLVYTDGILFYDSVVPMSRIYFMDGKYPKPVSLYTLGSPLKDHNMLPEIANSVVVTDSSDIRLSGMVLKDGVYHDLLRKGFGFYERMSSSLNKPYAYVARFMPLDNHQFKELGFVDGCTLRVGIELGNKKPIEPGRF